MNISQRITELIQNPSQLAESDLPILQAAKEKYPYAQIFHALYLKAANTFDEDTFRKYAGTAAAYSSDKKSLYAYIAEAETLTITDTHSETETAEPQTEISTENQTDTSDDLHLVQTEIDTHSEAETTQPQTEISTENQTDTSDELSLVETKTDTHSEAETTQPQTEISTENQTDTSDDLSLTQTETDTHSEAETTQQQSEISTEKQADTSGELDVVQKETNSHSEAETAVNTEDRPEKTTEKLMEHKTNFHQTGNFMQNVLPRASADHIPAPETQTPAQKKRETEIEKLIREVEEKMRKNKKNTPKIAEESVPEHLQHAVSFSPDMLEESTTKEVSEIKRQETPEDTNDTSRETTEHTASESNVPKFYHTWKEWLSLGTHKEHSHTAEDNSTTSESEEQTEEYTADTATAENDFAENEESTHTADLQEESFSENENSDDEEDPVKRFIETNPKMPKSKKDAIYQAPREKGDDISHLMTETLAKIYWEQRLYTKAIQGFLILAEKHPENKAQYDACIEEINIQRQGKTGDEF